MLGLATEPKSIQIFKKCKKEALSNLSKVKCVEKALVIKDCQWCSELPESWREQTFWRKKSWDEKYVKYAIRISSGCALEANSRGSWKTVQTLVENCLLRTVHGHSKMMPLPSAEWWHAESWLLSLGSHSAACWDLVILPSSCLWRPLQQSIVKILPPSQHRARSAGFGAPGILWVLIPWVNIMVQKYITWAAWEEGRRWLCHLP